MNLIRAFALAVISFFTVSALKAQDVQMAILQHGDNASAYYGTPAFGDAMKAAVKGDVITLSAGIFTSVTIDKAVTIQGAGYVTDVAKGRYKTVLEGDIDVSLPQDTDETLIIEGISVHNVTIKTAIIGLSISKSRINKIDFSSTNNNCIIDKCIINRFNPERLTTNLTMKNSIIGDMYSYSSSDNSLIENCVLHIYSRENNCLKGAVIRNSIISCEISLNITCSSYNNCFVAGDCGQSLNQANNYSDTSTSVFGSNVVFSSLAIPNINFTLTESAAAKYLGTDGKQVGIYGGDSPFTDVPSTPQITIKSIDSKVSNGKLNATIHVEAQN